MKSRVAAVGAAAGVVVAVLGAVVVLGLRCGPDSALADAGLRAYAWASLFVQRIPMGLFLPVIAVTLSFRVGSRLGRRARRAEAAALAAPRQAPVVHSVILFMLASLISLIFMAERGMLR